MRKFIIGDLHGNTAGESHFLSKNQWIEGDSLNKEDILFQLGDFGYVFAYPENLNDYKKQYNQRKELASKKYTILIILGNHENYDVIEKLPIIDKWGGKVYKEDFGENSLYYAIRGEIYTINGKSFFTFGGAISSDISDRNSFDELGKEKFLDKYRYGEKVGKKRIKVTIGKINYWSREVHSFKDIKNALKNLKKVNYKVDYVLTHTCPDRFLNQFIKLDDSNQAKFNCPVAKFLDILYERIYFKNWYFGHLHVNKTVDNFTCHYYKKPIEIDLFK